MENDNLFLPLSFDVYLRDEELAHLICRLSQVCQHVLRPNRQDSPLVLQLVLDDVELSVEVVILYFGILLCVTKYVMLDECAVLIQLELANRAHGARLKIDPHELVLTDDFLASFRVLL